MPTPKSCMDMAAALLNDTALSTYNYVAQLPYLNIALNDLEEQFELNNIPVTSATSAIIPVNANKDHIGFDTQPPLPFNLVEIREAWESERNQNKWTPMTKKNYLPHYLEGSQISQLLIWSWEENKMKFLPASGNNDVKLDYIKSLFAEVLIGGIGIDLGVELKNTKTYLGYRTGALCAMFIGQDVERAIALSTEADKAILRSMGISVKGTQSIAVRRRPYRASYKSRVVS